MALDWKSSLLIVSYLGANVFANSIVGNFGQAALPYTGFFFIPFDLVARDVLHDRWQNSHVLLRMIALVLCGSVLSYLLNADIKRIAIASFFGFLCSGAVDTIAYQLLRERSKLTKINSSNFFSSITDSVVFPLIAFDSISIWLCAWQAAAKFIGGTVWGFLFVKFGRRFYV